MLIEHLNLSCAFISVSSSDPHSDLVRRWYCSPLCADEAVKL